MISHPKESSYGPLKLSLFRFRHQAWPARGQDCFQICQHCSSLQDLFRIAPTQNSLLFLSTYWTRSLNSISFWEILLSLPTRLPFLFGWYLQPEVWNICLVLGECNPWLRHCFVCALMYGMYHRFIGWEASGRETLCSHFWVFVSNTVFSR